MFSKKWMQISVLARSLSLIGAMALTVVAFAAGPSGQGGNGNQATFQQQACGMGEFVDADGDGVCDNAGLGRMWGQGAGGAAFVDANGDGVCDNWADADGDGINDNAPRPQDGTGMKHGRMGRGRGGR